ncbi:hypothetical protein DFH94DRAFT_732898 [Russula ochroleuca]|uniref:Uncharacterized protein n=1 Tax=Russula ochroleuca TaxID=152965 RepID=A0A9P5MYI4_9AGAM|nr:hypothetical protein DFH94DRAFT_732898 [Russula ochroleuca]
MYFKLPAAILLDAHCLASETSVTVFSYYSNITMIILVCLISLCRVEVNRFRTRSSSTERVLKRSTFNVRPSGLRFT